MVDCRGFHVKPALVPKICDENGNEIFGPSCVSRVHAVKGGTAVFARGDRTAEAPRISGNPLVVKGIRTKKQGVSDIIIGNSDAARIRGTPSNMDLLQRCKDRKSVV